MDILVNPTYGDVGICGYNCCDTYYPCNGYCPKPLEPGIAW